MAYYPNYGQYQNNQSYTSNNIKSMEWVDGEVGAKVFSQPIGWPAEIPIVLWDNSAKRIYIKSWNQMGMPNPIQELDYEIKERTNPALLPNNISGIDMSRYATKDDIDQIKQELKTLTNMLSNTNNGGRNNNNRSDNK